MKKKRKKIIELLGKQFGNDPKAVQAIHEAIADDYEKELEEKNKEHKSEMDSLKKEHREEMKTRDENEEKRHKSAMQAITSARDAAVKFASEAIESYKKNAQESLREREVDFEKKMEKKYGSRLTKHWERMDTIERSPGFQIGGPGRSIYLNGNLISNRYSDINLIPGTGVTITEVDNETFLRADVTITAAGGAVNIKTEALAGVQAGANVTLTFSGLSHTPTNILGIFRNGQLQPSATSAPADGSSAVNVTGTTSAIVYNAADSDTYLVEYTY